LPVEKGDTALATRRPVPWCRSSAGGGVSLFARRLRCDGLSIEGATTNPFNLGLFRGIAGVGHTVLRRIEPSLPNVLIWE
jgi:hypothetical protein